MGVEACQGIQTIPSRDRLCHLGLLGHQGSPVSLLSHPPSVLEQHLGSLPGLQVPVACDSNFYFLPKFLPKAIRASSQRIALLRPAELADSQIARPLGRVPRGPGHDPLLSQAYT